MSSSSPSRVEDVAEDAHETEEDPLLSFRHIRTASVILPSGDRVRRKVSLMLTYDENPFEDDERQPLLDTRSGENTACSFIPGTGIDREISPWEPSRFDKMKSFLRSEVMISFGPTKCISSSLSKHRSKSHGTVRNGSVGYVL